MVTNLIFSRNVKSEGIEKTELKIIEVDIPGISATEGWKLINNADKVTTEPRITGRCKTSEEVHSPEDSAATFMLNLVSDNPIDYSNYANSTCNTTSANINTVKSNENAQEIEKEPCIREFPSPVPGTACLIRANNELRIAYRSGKNANITTPNRVCISDADKQNFFNAVRVENPGITNIKKWVLKPGGCRSLFDHWNAYFDEEYLRQFNHYKHSQKSKR